jgi:hypothetical protein
MRSRVSTYGWIAALMCAGWSAVSWADPPLPGTATANIAPADSAATAPTFDNMFIPGAAGAAQPIMFNNRPITTLRSHVMGHGPEERADVASHRIREVLHRTTSDSVTIRAAANALAIMVGDEGVFLLTPFDPDVERGETLAAAAEQAAANLRRAIAEYREQRN